LTLNGNGAKHDDRFSELAGWYLKGEGGMSPVGLLSPSLTNEINISGWVVNISLQQNPIHNSFFAIETHI
jgi:hypothetical protein